MNPRLVISTALVAALALVSCKAVKEKIPFLGSDEAGEAAGEPEEKREEAVEEEKAEEKKEEAAKEEPPPEEQGEKEEEPGEAAEEEPPEEEAAEQEPPEEEAAEEEPPAEEPAGDPSVKSDIPKHIKSKTKITKVLVVGHQDELAKYRKAAQKATPAIRECHRSALMDKPKTTGKIKFKINISPKGKAVRVEVGKNNTGSDDLAACCVEAFKAHSWPKRSDDEMRSLTIPIMFVTP